LNGFIRTVLIGGNDESFTAGNSRSYLMWAFGARREKLGLDGGNIEEISGEELRSTALRVMAQRSWNKRFCALVRLADADTINAITIRTSVPIVAWQTQRVTLLGDATPAMTPYRGNWRQRRAQRRCAAMRGADNGESRRAFSDRLSIHSHSHSSSLPLSFTAKGLGRERPVKTAKDYRAMA
jgi:hypothetical protein